MWLQYPVFGMNKQPLRKHPSYPICLVIFSPNRKESVLDVTDPFLLLS